jgi:carboxylate-amine ligase
MAIVALYCCLLRMLWRLKRLNTRWRRYKNLLINENRWRAMRYGFDGGLVDFGRGEMVDYPLLLEEILELVAEDAEALDCVEAVHHAKTILETKTSAHNQLRVFDEAIAAGMDKDEALRRVVDWLVEQTRSGA